MNSILKKLLPVTLLLLSGCTHHYGLHSGRQHYRNSHNGYGAYVYNNRHHDYRHRGYEHDWNTRSPQHHFYGSEHNYRKNKRHNKHYHDEHKHSRGRSKHYKHDDRRHDKPRLKMKMPRFKPFKPFFW